MELRDGTSVMCPQCKRSIRYSKADLRRTRLLIIDCPFCQYKETIMVDARPELVAEILSIALGNDGQHKVDSRTIKEARADYSSNRLALSFKNGEHLAIPAPNLQSDIETLESCGIAVLPNS